MIWLLLPLKSRNLVKFPSLCNCCALWCNFNCKVYHKIVNRNLHRATKKNSHLVVKINRVVLF
jgi:hypothetical protein